MSSGLRKPIEFDKVVICSLFLFVTLVPYIFTHDNCLVVALVSINQYKILFTSFDSDKISESKIPKYTGIKFQIINTNTICTSASGNKHKQLQQHCAGSDRNTDDRGCCVGECFIRFGCRCKCSIYPQQDYAGLVF